MFVSNKEWYKSRTIWAGSVSFASGIALFFGYSLDPSSLDIEGIMAVISSLGGLGAIYGRVKASAYLTGG